MNNLKGVLVHNEYLKFLKDNDQLLLSYLSLNIHGLIYYSLTDDCGIFGKMAFAAIINYNKEIFGLFHSNNYFFTRSSRVLTQKEPNRIFLHRILSISTILLTNPSLHSQSSCGFLFQLIPLISDLSVLAFFERILTYSDELRTVHEWLKNMGFSQVISNEISCIDVGLYNEYHEFTYSLINLFKIVQYSHQNPILSLDFKSFPIISAISRPFDSLPETVVDEQWKTYVSLYDNDSYDVMRVFFEQALSLMQNPTQIMRQSRVYSIALLTKMMKVDKDLIPFLSDSHIECIVLQLLYQFSDHSILINTIIFFVVEAFSNPGIREQMAKTILLPLLFDGAKKELPTLSAATHLIVDGALDAGNNDSSFMSLLLHIPGFSNYVETELKTYHMRLKSSYGD